MQNNRIYQGLLLDFLMPVVVSIAAVIPVQGQDPSVREVIKTLLEVEEFKAEELGRLDSLPVESVPILTEELNRAPEADDARQYYLLAGKVAQLEASIPPDDLDAAVAALSARLKVGPEMSQTYVTLLRIKLKKVEGIRDRRLKEVVRSTRSALGEDLPPASPREMKRGNVSSPSAASHASSALETKRGLQKGMDEEPEGLGTWWPLVFLLPLSGAFVWWLRQRKVREASGLGES